MPPLITLQDSFTLSICNRTDQHVFASSAHSTGEKGTYPARSTRDSPLHLTTSQKSLLVNLFNKRDELLCELDLLVVPLGNATSKWKSIYTFNHSSIRLLHRIIPQSIVQLLILPQRDCATFLSSLDDATCLTSFCLPGTHDSLSLYGWPISSCQASDSSVTKQLNDGIRYLDVRLAPKGLPGKERLLAYHGITDQRIEFGKVLDECFDFLNGVGRHGEHNGIECSLCLIEIHLCDLIETIIMSLKQESGLQDTFIKLLFTKYVDQSPATPDGILASGRHRWFLEDRVPRLGEARGKIVMLSRFVIHPSYNLPGGISPPIWPNDLKEP
jgi:1-phosphatidylinositol phosphodiesterase